MVNDIVGIDLGTTNSSIGVIDSGFPLLLADEDGHRLTPSVVAILDNGEQLVGRAAARMRLLRPECTAYSVKRFIGLRGHDLPDEDLKVEYEVIRRPGEPLHLRLGGHDYLPEQVSAIVLSKLKLDGERALGHGISRAVITAPAYFNDAQRSATKRAGELAGFAVERIVSEPTAAALAYGLDKVGGKGLIGVYDLGGGTFDLSILELNGGVFQVIATNGNTRLGGDDIDRAILADARFAIATRTPEQKARLYEAIVTAKHRLSVEDEVSIEIPFFDTEKAFSTVLSRRQLNEIARPVIESTRLHCLRALSDAKLDARDLDEIILVGGVTRMPLVRQFVAELFGREPNTEQNPEEAVGLGATIQAGILGGAVRDIVLLDVTPLSLGLETFGGLMNVIIPRNSTIPIKAGEMFTTAVGNQRSMSIKVLQGERELARDNWKLGEFEIEFEPAAKGAPRVGVQFEIDANGILHVLARDTRTGHEKVVEIKSAVDVSDEAVEAMLTDAVDHAFEDVNERLWVETKLKAEEILAAVEKGFEAIPDERISPTERAHIRTSAENVRRALAAGDRQNLKRATDALDAATQHMASMIVESLLASEQSRSESR